LISAGTFTTAFGIVIIYTVLVLFDLAVQLTEFEINPDSK
jgi:hypothetical protein